MVRSLLLIPLMLPAALAAQASAVLEAERADYSDWLNTSPASPYAAVFHQPLSGDLVFGPGGHPALTRAPAATLSMGRRGITLDYDGRTRAVPRHRDVTVGDWRIRVSGSGGVTTVTAFAPREGPAGHPGWFPFQRQMIVEGSLRRAERASERRMLGLDGVETVGTLAGEIEGTVAGEDFSLTVYGIPVGGSDEVELSVFLRDGTSGVDTYPPGRFVILQPLGGGRYRMDFNRARNPFCAYNPLFPCPLPWSGNTLGVRIEAGELYHVKND